MSAGWPEAAVVAVTSYGKGQVVFATDDRSRKLRNIHTDNRVALTIGWDDLITIQINGLAEIIYALKERSDLARCHLESHPGSREFANSGHEKFIKVRPCWIRYSDYRQADPIQFELTYSS